MKTLIFLLLAPIAFAIDYTYDSAGQLIAESFPDGSHTLYHYDSIGNATSTVSMEPTANPAADLETTISSSPSSPLANQITTITITVTNNGPNPATQVTVTDAIPAGFTTLRTSSSQGQAEIESGTLTANLGTLANGATATITIEGSSETPTNVTFAPSATAPEDNTPANNSATENLVFGENTATDLALALTAGPKPTFLPGKILFEALVTNHGPATATDTTLTLPLVGATTLNNSNLPAVTTATDVTFDLGNLAAGASAQVLFSLNPPAAPAGLVFTATASATSPELTLSNNTASDSLSLQNGTLVVTNTNNTGAGSLRQAIQDANASNTADIITFNIPGGAIPSIPLVDTLDRIGPDLIIDGFSQPEGRVELDGSGLPNPFFANNLLNLGGSNITIRSLVINGHSPSGAIGGEVLAQDGQFDFHENLTIEGCYLGTDITGTTAVLNGGDGIGIFEYQNVTIGGPEFWQRNLISGNEDHGIDLASSNRNVKIINNYIGTDITGTQDLGNGRSGIESEAPETLIKNNLISGNDSFGLTVEEANVVVQGNKIGTAADGTTTLPNTLQGLIGTFDSDNNVLIGGIHEGEGNLISGNSRTNVELTARGFTLAGNLIGPDITGTIGLSSTDFNADGVELDADGPNFVGLPVVGGGNIISGNRNNGIEIPFHDNHVIQNNRIGTSSDGLSSVPNLASGILINGGEQNQIGGAGHHEGNLISGNNSAGVRVSSSSSRDNRIQGNTIGINLDQAPLPNLFAGVHQNGSAINTLIGGTEENEGNTIAHNDDEGVLIAFGSASILGNSIFENGTLGIKLGFGDDPLLNDVGDPDTGANSFQNSPIITTAGTSITGTLNSESETAYRIELFSNSAVDPTSHGEGRTFLGFLETITDANGDSSFTFNPTTPPVAGQFITATATNPDNETSEFGLAVIVTGDSSGFNDSDGDGISDEYELEHFGSETAGDPNEDSDGDGQNNLAEFLALTDPNDPTSFLTIDIRIENGNAIISLNSESGRTYQLHSDDDLQDFQPLGAPISGDGNILEFIDSVSTHRFYRITVAP